MGFYLINVLGDQDNTDLVVLDKSPVGMGADYFRLADGMPAKDFFPQKAIVHMSPDRDGIGLGSLIASTQSFLIVHKDVKEKVLANIDKENIESFPFTLINHKGKPHSNDYFFINPLVVLDCLDIQASGIVFFEDTDHVVDMDEFVLDAKKVERAPAIFRIKEATEEYVISEELAQELTNADFTNIVLTKLKITDSVE